MNFQAITPTSSQVPMRKPWACVLDATTSAAHKVDWSSWYLTDEEDMGEGVEQFQIIQLFLSCLQQLAQEQGWQNVFLGADQFFAWIEHEPLVRVSPDVYVLDDPPPQPWPRMWETWKPGQRPPRFALEIVSQDWSKDYEQSPLKYAQLGTKELVIFDPEAARNRGRNKQRVALQLHRRGEDGVFVREYAGPGPVYSEQLGVYLVNQAKDGGVWLRLSKDASGTELIPSRVEAEQARVKEEQERVKTEQARVKAEQERVKTEQARVKEEQERVKTEQARVKAEQDRADAAEARIRELEAQVKAQQKSN